MGWVGWEGISDRSLVQSLSELIREISDVFMTRLLVLYQNIGSVCFHWQKRKSGQKSVPYPMSFLFILCVFLLLLQPLPFCDIWNGYFSRVRFSLQLLPPPSLNKRWWCHFVIKVEEESIGVMCVSDGSWGYLFHRRPIWSEKHFDWLVRLTFSFFFFLIIYSSLVACFLYIATTTKLQISRKFTGLEKFSRHRSSGGTFRDWVGPRFPLGLLKG